AWIGKWYTRRQLRRVKQRFASGHSHRKTYSLNGISITAIPINKDNYGYVIVNDDSKDCVLIDVGDCDPCLQFLHSNNYIPSAVLTTHKHWDHCYGNKGMLHAYPNLKLYGSKVDRPYGTNVFVSLLLFVKEGDESIEIGSFRFSTLFVPGHTKGHIIYRLLNPNGQDCLFTGDFLFIGGIGHIFEGTTKRALKSLNLLQCLPRSALIFPGHEYSLKNIQFASKLQPENKTLKRIEESVRQKRIQKMPSVGCFIYLFIYLPSPFFASIKNCIQLHSIALLSYIHISFILHP
ncbi:unnamed protein product, partial [Anisakis simplex]|uniref:Probable hydrolase PNKD (inferred by orthology to a human protein) n=1 Tax=Anisakis simplex TaxID=6269 RepID=A0A0M3J6T7_ANISI